jgi:hypothetical protein
MYSRLLPLVLLLIAATMVSAQSTDQQAEPEPSTQSLLDLIHQLQRRVSELEEHERQHSQSQLACSDRGSSAETVPAQAPNATAPPQETHTHEEPSTAVREAEQHYPSLQVRGFGDIDFGATDHRGSTSGFDLGQFVLHFVSPLSRKVSYFGEVSFTASPSGYDLSVERSIIRYDYNDYFKMSFGKYHTPVSYWNTAFHHGAWLQTTISRPEMVRIGGTFIPIHFVGLQAEGNIPSGGLGLGYNVGLGNGRSSSFSKAGDSGDSNNNRAWVATLFARPARLYGLQVGGSFYRDKLTPNPGVNFDEWIGSAHVVWAKQHPEVLAEVANVHHRDPATSQTFNTTAYYVQLAYRFPWQENKWKPYYRFEYIHRPQVEPVWDITGTPSVSDLVGSTVGLRYDITNYAAFKGEYRRMRHGVGEPFINGAFLQTAFTF